MKAVLARYLEVFPDETERLRVLQDFLRETPEGRQLYDRKNFNGHITASGFVLSADRNNLVLVKHKVLDRYLQPGGHVEASDPTVLDAAVREVREETGLSAFCTIKHNNTPSQFPLDIDTHEIPANPAKKEPKHWHHDFRYLFCVDSQIDPLDYQQQGEGQWVWRPLDAAIEEETFKFVVRKIRKFAL